MSLSHLNDKYTSKIKTRNWQTSLLRDKSSSEVLQIFKNKKFKITVHVYVHMYVLFLCYFLYSLDSYF